MKLSKWAKFGICLCASVLLLSACGSKKEDTAKAEQKKELGEMTNENITLTYASWENSSLQQYLADKFMEKYPNIKVELVTVDQDVWNDGLTNLASAGQLPDAYCYEDCTWESSI